MSQYTTGTVDVTNGSNAVVGTGTLWLAEITVGDLFTVVDSGITYEVSSITDDTHLTLSTNYAGVTASGLSYVIARDFTPNFNLPYINKGDIETPSILKRAILRIDSFLSNVATEIHAATSKATPVDADELGITDSEDGWSLKKITLATLSTFIKNYYDSVVSTLTSKTINLADNTLTGTRAEFDTVLSDDNFVYESDKFEPITVTPVADTNHTFVQNEYQKDEVILTDGVWTTNRYGLVPNKAWRWFFDNRGTHDWTIDVANPTLEKAAYQSAASTVYSGLTGYRLRWKPDGTRYYMGAIDTSGTVQSKIFQFINPTIPFTFSGAASFGASTDFSTLIGADWGGVEHAVDLEWGSAGGTLYVNHPTYIFQLAASSAYYVHTGLTYGGLKKDITSIAATNEGFCMLSDRSKIFIADSTAQAIRECTLTGDITTLTYTQPLDVSDRVTTVGGVRLMNNDADLLVLDKSDGTVHHYRMQSGGTVVGAQWIGSYNGAEYSTSYTIDASQNDEQLYVIATNIAAGALRINRYTMNAAGGEVVPAGTSRLLVCDGAIVKDANEYLPLSSKTLIGTAAQFDTACSDDNFMFDSDKATDFSVIDNNKVPTTQAVSDFVSSSVAGLLDLRGNYDASSNLYPSTGGSGTAGAVLKGDAWYISVAGTLGTTPVISGDLVYAVIDTPDQTEANWQIVGSGIEQLGLNINAASSKATIADNDKFAISDSESSNTLKHLTFANLKTNIANWLSTLAATWSNKTLTAGLVSAEPADNDASLLIAPTRFVKREIAADIGADSRSQTVFVTSATATGTGLTRADSAEVDLGTYDFSLIYEGALPNWVPTAARILIHKHDGSNGVIFSLEVGGYLSVTINASTYTATATASLSAYQFSVVEAIVTRETATAAGEVRFYADSRLIDTVAIASAATVSVNNASPLYIAGTLTTRTGCETKSVYLMNYAMSASDQLIFYRNGGPVFADRFAQMTPIYASDYSAGVDGAAGATGGSIAGNIDAIGGEDDWLRFTSDAATSTHGFRIYSPIRRNSRYSVSIKYYIPSSNTSLKGLLVSGPTGASVFIPAEYDTDAVATAYGIIGNTLSSTAVHVFAVDAGGNTTFAGTSGDLFYIKEVQILRRGCVAAYEPDGIQQGQWMDSSPNKLHLSYPTLQEDSSFVMRPQSECVYEWTAAINTDTTLTGIVPAGFELQDIVFNNSTAGPVSVRLGTTAGGTELFGLTALNTSATFGGFTTVDVKQALSASATTTLYLSSTDWTGGGTPPSLTFTMHFSRVS